MTKEEAEVHGNKTLEKNDSTLTVPDSADTVEVKSASKVQSEAGDNCENQGKLGHDYQVEEALDNFPTDLGNWPGTVPEIMRSFWIERGSKECQYKDNGFEESAVKLVGESHRRYCTLSLFTKVHKLTNKRFDRTWLCYSKINGHVCVQINVFLGQSVYQWIP